MYIHIYQQQSIKTLNLLVNKFSLFTSFREYLLIFSRMFYAEIFMDISRINVFNKKNIVWLFLQVFIGCFATERMVIKKSKKRYNFSSLCESIINQ